MEFEWDEAKSAATLGLRGFGLAAIRQIPLTKQIIALSVNVGNVSKCLSDGVISWT